MKTIFFTLALGTVILFSCNNSNPIAGSWNFDNLSNEDSSMSRETLMATFIVTHWSEIKTVTFSADNKITLSAADGKEIGTGNYKLTDNNSLINLKFPDDKIESKYKIIERTDKQMKITATDDGETANIILSR